MVIATWVLTLIGLWLTGGGGIIMGSGNVPLGAAIYTLGVVVVWVAWGVSN